MTWPEAFFYSVCVIVGVFAFFAVAAFVAAQVMISADERRDKEKKQ